VQARPGRRILGKSAHQGGCFCLQALGALYQKLQLQIRPERNGVSIGSPCLEVYSESVSSLVVEIRPHALPESAGDYAEFHSSCIKEPYDDAFPLCLDLLAVERQAL